MAEKKKDDKLEKCEADRDEYLNGWKRAKADLINYKKEEAQRLEGFAKFALEDTLQELLVVLDSFELALASAQDEGTKKGVMMIKSQLEGLLRRKGLEKISVKEGDAFDPALHEAVEEGEGESGKIIEVLVLGYRLNGKVLRPTKVKVAQ